MENQNKIIGHIKGFTITHSQKFALAIGLITLVIVTAIAVSVSANSVNVAEMKKNSDKWHEYQKISVKAETLLNEARTEQEKLEERNELLRQVFTKGENQL